MPLKTKHFILAIVIVQIAFFSIWYLIESQKLSDPEAKEILVRTVPIDPRDYISGNYFILRYEFSNIFRLKKRGGLSWGVGKEVYVVFKQREKWFVADYVTHEKPRITKDQAVLKGVVTRGGQVEYGIEKFFINENRKEPSRGKDMIEVLLKIDENYQGRIKSLMVNGQEF